MYNDHQNWFQETVDEEDSEPKVNISNTAVLIETWDDVELTERSGMTSQVNWWRHASGFSSHFTLTRVFLGAKPWTHPNSELNLEIYINLNLTSEIFPIEDLPEAEEEWYILLRYYIFLLENQNNKLLALFLFFLPFYNNHNYINGFIADALRYSKHS